MKIFVKDTCGDRCSLDLRTLFLKSLSLIGSDYMIINYYSPSWKDNINIYPDVYLSIVEIDKLSNSKPKRGEWIKE